MKARNLFFILSFVLLFAGCCQKTEEKAEISVISYNMRLSSADDGENSWQYRKEATSAMIDSLKPDLLGVQEAKQDQIEFIMSECPEYGHYGVGRDDGISKGEHMSIFYRKDAFDLLDSFTYWLSETPDVPSKGWDAQCRRTATVTYFEHKATKKRFFYVNTHLDHKGLEAQKKGLELIVNKIDSINPEKLPLILTGDFNMVSSNEAILALDKVMLNTRSVAPVTDTLATFNGWGESLQEAAIGDNMKSKPVHELIIDYIFYSPMDSTMCKEYRTITEEFASVPFISDHYPIKAILTF